MTKFSMKSFALFIWRRVSELANSSVLKQGLLVSNEGHLHVLIIACDTRFSSCLSVKFVAGKVMNYMKAIEEIGCS